MVVAVLSFIASDEEISAGIPRFMTIESNVPATIYFTLDGTTPDTNSPIYSDTFEMPDGENTVILSAFGVDSGDISGPILVQIFAPDITKLDRTHHIKVEGIAVDRFADPTNITEGFDADSNAAVFADDPNIDLRILRSDKGLLGIAEGTVIEIGTPLPPNTPFPFDDPFQAESSPSDNFFNPYAKTIIIDHREDNVIRILNRPYGSMRSLHREAWGVSELSSTDSTYISGGFVKRFYSQKTNTMGSYYFDHHSNRWVVGLQDLPASVPNIGFAYTSQPLVFKWIDRGRHSSIL